MSDRCNFKIILLLVITYQINYHFYYNMFKYLGLTPVLD